MKKQKTGASSTGATSTISPSCSKSKQKGRTKMYCVSLSKNILLLTWPNWYSFLTQQLNFARYRKTGLSYKKCSGNVQVSGFTDGDKYSEVVAKGAKGLDIKADPKSLSLVISNALVLDVLFSGNQPWTLGSYVEEFGGVSARGKKTFGIYVPPELEEGDVCANQIQNLWHCTTILCISQTNLTFVGDNTNAHKHCQAQEWKWWSCCCCK